MNNSVHLHSLPKGYLLHRSHLRLRSRQLPNLHSLPLEPLLRLFFLLRRPPSLLQFRIRQRTNPSLLLLKLSLLQPFKGSAQIMDLFLAVSLSLLWGLASVKVRACSFDLVSAPCSSVPYSPIHTPYMHAPKIRFRRTCLCHAPLARQV